MERHALFGQPSSQQYTPPGGLAKTVARGRMVTVDAFLDPRKYVYLLMPLLPRPTPVLAGPFRIKSQAAPATGKWRLTCALQFFCFGKEFQKGNPQAAPEH